MVDRWNDARDACGGIGMPLQKAESDAINPLIMDEALQSDTAPLGIGGFADPTMVGYGRTANGSAGSTGIAER